jgi:hypothetical protein
MHDGRRILGGLWILGALGCSTAGDPGAPARTEEALVNDGEQKVLPPLPENAQRFGASVAISDTRAVVGVPQGDRGRGAAFIYERSGPAWVLRQKLAAPNGGQFGSTVALSGSTIVVGAPQVPRPTFGNIGAVYVYGHDGVAATLTQTIPSEAPFNGGQFIQYGNHLALDGSVLLIGDDSVIHVLNRVGGLFNETQTIAPLSSFGNSGSMALSGNTLIRCASPGGGAPSVADVFVSSGSPATFQLEQRIVPMVGNPQPSGCGALALSGNTAITIGPDGDGTAGYVFVRSGSTWTAQGKLVEPNPAPFDVFGAAVALAGDVAVIGAPLRDHEQRDAGSAFVFTRSGGQWTPTRELIASDGGQGDAFGSSLAVSADFALVGAPNDDVPAIAQGSAYFFALDPLPPAEICVGTCSVDADCPAEKYCEASGLCLPKKARGRACETADCRAAGCAVCATGFCVDGFCCEDACSGEGLACSSVLTGRANGICHAVSQNSCGTGGAGSGGSGGSGASGTGGGGGSGTGGSSSTETGGAGPSAGGSTGMTGGAGGVAGSGGSEAPCVRVAPDGDDAAAVASNGVTPFRNVQPAIDFADAHRDVASRVCVAAGATCGAETAFTFSGPEGSDLRMRNGINVAGRYESTTWTQCTDSVVRLLAKTGRGVVFGPDITTLTELGAVEVLGPAETETAAVTVDGARGARLFDMSVASVNFASQVTYGVRIGPGSEVTIERSRIILVPGSVRSAALFLSDADLMLTDSSVSSTGGSALDLDDPRDVRVLRCEITGEDAAVIAVGDIEAVTIEDSTIDASASTRAARGVEIASKNPTGVTLRGNVVRVGGSYDLIGITLVGGGAVVDSNQVELVSFGGRGNALGIQCDGLDAAASCREVTGNVVTGPSCILSCAYDSKGMVVAGMSTLVDSNRVDGGCSSGAAWSAAVGLVVSGDARVQNNVLYGSTCASANEGVQGTGLVVDSERGVVDLSSNYIDGGRATAAGCATAGIRLLQGDVVLRNNIVAPGLCPNAVNLHQEREVIVPTVLENNDLAPGSPTAQLYRIIGAVDPTTIAEVNALPGAGANFSAACQYPLLPESACVDAGTPEGAPERDIEGDLRDDGAPDVGPDEIAGVPSPPVP